MALLNVVYIHCKDPDLPDCRRKTVAEMNEYLKGLVCELVLADIPTDYDVKEGDRNDVTINGKSVRAILEDLGDDIRTPEIEEEDVKPTVTFEKPPRVWNPDYIEDISDLLMKNAFSKAFADASKLQIPTIN